MRSSEYNQGYSDFYNGNDECPFSNSEQEAKWRLGWEYALEEDQESQMQALYDMRFEDSDGQYY